MGFYPVFLELEDRRCLVVGGGTVAERTVEGLLAAGAQVTVVSATVTPQLNALLVTGRIPPEARAYQPGDLGGFDLGFAATDDGAVNGTLAREGRSRGIWVNAADDLTNSDFILPGIVRRGSLTVAVGSGGASPALVRAVREDLERYLGPEYAELAELVADVRRELRARGRSPNGAAWSRLWTPSSVASSKRAGANKPGSVCWIGWEQPDATGHSGTRRCRSWRHGPVHPAWETAVAPGRRRGLRPSRRSPRGGARAGWRASHLRRQGEWPACPAAGRDQRHAHRARAAGSARSAAQGGRPVRLWAGR